MYKRRVRALTSYRLGTAAFVVGTLVWGVDVWLTSGAVDPAAAVYLVGCLFFVDDAFRKPWRHSYRAGTVAYAVGTVMWGVAAWRATREVDIAAALYLIGCIYFLLDAFGARMPALFARLPVTSQQLGAVSFLAGTAAWWLSSGLSVPVAAYGLGCLCFLRDAFKRRAAPSPEPA